MTNPSTPESTQSSRPSSEPSEGDTAVPSPHTNCIFCKIAGKQIAVELVFENDEFVAFRDMHPQAPVHVLLIPKSHYPTIMDIHDEGLLGRMLLAVQQTAAALDLQDEGFRTVLNCRDNGGQTVYHVHWHILGGRFMQWPPG